MSITGLFFSFDGVDGAGKSTQISQFGDWLVELGYDVVRCRDPGSTQLSEAIRPLLLDRHDVPIGRRSEMLLYMAARAQLVDEVIMPALESGRTVLSDRFLLANVVYQGYAGGLDVEATWEVGRIATTGIAPDLTFILDLDVDLALSRLKRQPDRMESRGREFLSQVRNGFLVEAARSPERMVVIDASHEPRKVQAVIQSVTRQWLSQRGKVPQEGTSQK